MRVFRPYIAALRQEPRARAFVFATFVDDVGVAASRWASTLLLTNLFTDQRARGELDAADPGLRGHVDLTQACSRWRCSEDARSGSSACVKSARPR